MSVSAINETTLTVTGVGLKNLKIEDLTIDGNKVVAITASEDGETASITLDSKLAPNAEVVLKVKDGETTTEFKTNFEYKVTSVELVEATFDDDLAGQKITFNVNGKAADTDYLALAGYDVNLVAVQKTTGVATPLFTGASNISATGELSATLLAGEDYEVEIQLIKSGEALVADKGIIKIRNIEATTSMIDNVKFALNATTGVPVTTPTYNTGAVPFTDNDFVLNSTKLVAGEEFYVNQVNATVVGEKVISPETSVSVKSSNPAVISAAANGILTAQSAGTATITVKVGDVTKDYTFTVTNKARELTTVTATPASTKVIVGKTTPVTVKTLDQYGDPIAVVAGAVAGTVAIDEVIPEVDVAGVATKIVTAASTDVVTTTVNSIGVVELSLAGQAAGKGTIYFKDMNAKVLGSLYVDVTDVDNVGSQKLEIKVPNKTTHSADTALDVLADSIVRYELSTYNTQGVYAGAQNLFAGTTANPGPYTIEVADKTVAYPTTAATKAAQDTAAGTGAQLDIVTAAAGENYFEVTGLKTGKTDVLLKDANGVVVAKQTITVVNDPIKINTVAWKSVPTINYAGKVVSVTDVLNITSSVAGSDDIVNGLTLSKATPHKVRIEGVGGTVGQLYLDTDGNGSFTVGEPILGTVTSDLATGATGVTAGANIFAATSSTITGDKGTVLFKVMIDPADATTAISATSVTIDVK